MIALRQTLRRGIEPLIFRLTVGRLNPWANRAKIIYNVIYTIVLRQTLRRGIEPLIFRLTVGRLNPWANRALIMYNVIYIMSEDISSTEVLNL